MPLYEHVYLARQDLSAQQVEEMTATFKGVVEGLGGKLVVDPEYWGVKTLSFRIRKNRKAHFTMFRLDAPSAAVYPQESAPSFTSVLREVDHGTQHSVGGGCARYLPLSA